MLNTSLEQRVKEVLMARTVVRAIEPGAYHAHPRRPRRVIGRPG
jgi:hypothetical protein